MADNADSQGLENPLQGDPVMVIGYQISGGLWNLTDLIQHQHSQQISSVLPLGVGSQVLPLGQVLVLHGDSFNHIERVLLLRRQLILPSVLPVYDDELVLDPSVVEKVYVVDLEEEKLE